MVRATDNAGSLELIGHIHLPNGEGRSPEGIGEAKTQRGSGNAGMDNQPHGLVVEARRGNTAQIGGHRTRTPGANPMGTGGRAVNGGNGGNGGCCECCGDEQQEDKEYNPHPSWLPAGYQVSYKRMVHLDLLLV
jgi:hypothetical protein